MKRIYLLMLSMTFVCAKAQITTEVVSDWDQLNEPGFYQSTNIPGVPEYSGPWNWFFGINIGQSNSNPNYRYNGQLLILNNPLEPAMYFRSISSDVNNRKADWAKVLHNKGIQSIQGSLGIGDAIPRAILDVNNRQGNLLKSVLARMEEGNYTGEGTYLGVKSYYTQPIGGEALDKIKSFAIEHKFHGDLNNAINFYRGLGETGGYIKIAVGTGKEVCKFYDKGLDVEGTIRAREVKIENTNWPDYVFSKNYTLPTLAEVSKHIEENKHLPGIPSAEEVAKDGINLSEMNAKLLQKIEEMTLYILQQEKRIVALEEKMEVSK